MVVDVESKLLAHVHDGLRELLQSRQSRAKSMLAFFSATATSVISMSGFFSFTSHRVE